MTRVGADPDVRVRAQQAAIAVVAGSDALAYRFGHRAASTMVRLGVAMVVLGIARGAGLSWAELGLGREELGCGVRIGAAAAACAAGTVLTGAAVPGTRSLFLDERAAADLHGSLAARLASITFAAVPAEELTYRSALLGLRLGDGRRPGAVAWSSALFGLSHILPTLSTMHQTVAGRHLAQRPLRQAAFVAGNVAVTGAAGAVFAWLRLRSGSVIAPILAHAALNDAALLAGRVAHASAAREARSHGHPQGYGLSAVAHGAVRADNRRVDDSRTRVVLADDDVLLREGLASLLDRSGLEVVGQAGDATELIEVVRQRRPELAVVDIRMPPKHATEGLDAARVIQREFPGMAVVVLSAHVEVEHAMDLLASGHRTGYLLKSRVTDIAEFIDTLKRVVRGGSAVDPALVQELVAARRSDDPLDVLTAREREVLALMAEGRSNAGIGQTLWVTEGTVEKHVRSIMMKLNLPETAEVHRRVLAVLAFLETR